MSDASTKSNTYSPGHCDSCTPSLSCLQPLRRGPSAQPLPRRRERLQGPLTCCSVRPALFALAWSSYTPSAKVIGRMARVLTAPYAHTRPVLPTACRSLIPGARHAVLAIVPTVDAEAVAPAPEHACRGRGLPHDLLLLHCSHLYVYLTMSPLLITIFYFNRVQQCGSVSAVSGAVRADLSYIIMGAPALPISRWPCDTSCTVGRQ